MKQFEHLKANFLGVLLLYQQNLYVVVYCCGAVLNIDLIYDSVTRGSNCHIEFQLELETKYVRSLMAIKMLFQIILNDAEVPNGSPFKSVLPILM